MDFIVDAQLPPTLCLRIKKAGHSAIHTSDLPLQNFTSDTEIAAISVLEKKVVITKDVDFYHSFILKREPYKLVFIKVGNMRKNDLNNFIESNFSKIVELLESNYMLEISEKEIKILY